ncbi:MAG: hydroxyacylglutathione hydrolase, partial [Gammaproteobacteria bacterium]|nr:hydroxyacylglutathione hydrolase [Gammaproteobacteria bacterium]
MPVIAPIPAFDDNYIWLILDEAERNAVIVDPGDGEPVLSELDRRGIEPAAILITHRHFDHVGGIGELLDPYPDLPVYGPAGEKVAGVNRPIGEGDLVELPMVGAILRVLDLPGHTLGHVGYYGEGALFCGDTLFAAGCGRLFEGTAEQMSGSLAKISALPKETLIYCAHEYTQDNIGFAKWVEP